MHRIQKRLSAVTKKQWLQMAGIAAVIILVVVIIKTHSPRAGSVPFTKEYSVSLVDYSGKTIRFDSFKQRPIVVFFWASWCPYCNAELTHLSALKAQYGNKIEILAVNRGESLQDAKTFSDALLLNPGIYLLLDHDDGLFKQLGGYAVPETIFVNSRGEQVVHSHGPLKPEEADAAIQQIF